MGQITKHIADQHGWTFTTNTQANPKDYYKVITRKSIKMIGKNNFEIEKNVVDEKEKKWWR